jgi:hypothetical protein
MRIAEKIQCRALLEYPLRKWFGGREGAEHNFIFILFQGEKESP